MQFYSLAHIIPLVLGILVLLLVCGLIVFGITRISRNINRDNFKGKTATNLKSLLCIAIVIASWVCNFGWIRFVMTFLLIPFIHAAAFWIINGRAAKCYDLSPKIKKLNFWFVVSYLVAYLLMIDGGDVGGTYVLFGQIHNDTFCTWANLISNIAFISNIVLLFIQVSEIKKVAKANGIQLFSRDDKPARESREIDEIWKIEKKENFVAAMYLYVAEKCGYAAMQNLNDAERVLYITQTLNAEVNNGGFTQFLFNSSGDFANEIVSAFEKIGAQKIADICKKAIGIYGDRVPVSRDERESVFVTVENKEILDECDDAFYECEDNLLDLSFLFIINNKESFGG